MKITSRFATRTFLIYMLFEHALVTTLLGAGIPACLFFGIAYLGRRNSDDAGDLMEMIFSGEGRMLMVVVAVLTILINVGLLFARRMPYVVHAELNNTRRCMVLGVRSPWKKLVRVTEVSYDRFRWSRYSTVRIPTVASYRGYAFMDADVLVGRFLVDHFTWDDQPRRIKEFLGELNERIPVSSE